MLFMYATITDGMPSWLATSLAIAGALIACIGLERLIPYRDDWRASQAAQQTDLVHIVLTELTGQGLVRMSMIVLGFGFGARINAAGPGVWSALGLSGLPMVVQLLLGLAVFDLGLYWLHRMMHERAALWPIHTLHHSPEALNAVSAIRNHPLNSFLSGCFSVLFGLLGMPMVIFAMVHGWLAIKGFLQHANADLRTPLFDPFFQTPRVHRWHHSERPAEADNNFGILLTLWDRIAWHRIPLLGKFLRFHRVTFFLPEGSDSPLKIGVGETFINPMKSPLANWGAHFAYPFRVWREQLPGPLWKVALTWLGWPVVMTSSVAAAWVLYNHGLPFAVAGLSVAFTSYGVAGVIQHLNPLREEWKGRGKDLVLDALHITLSMGTVNGLTSLALSALGAWLGAQVHMEIGGRLWGPMGGLPIAAQFLAALFVLDFLFYWQHRAMHEIPALWTTHRIHHAARTLSPTRAFRHHPVSPMLTAVMWAIIGLIGVPLEILAMCQAFHGANGALSHCNADLRLGRLEYIFASPTFHRWHHSRSLEDADLNFGPNVSVFDLVPWHKTPVIGKLLPIQHTTFRRGSDAGPALVGLDEHIEDPDRSPFYSWWFQVSNPFRIWLGMDALLERNDVLLAADQDIEQAAK